MGTDGGGGGGSFVTATGIVDRLEQLQKGNPPPVLSKPDLPETSPIISPPTAAMTSYPVPRG